MSDFSFSDTLLAWFDIHKRSLPWREARSPYRVWLSEMMLQQTVAKTAEPYFARFTARWPGVAALAAADLQEVLSEWAGLGYYARARNLHLAARIVANEHGGAFPDSEDELVKLPGVGPYAAAAIAALAFGRVSVVIDANVIRVLSRLYKVEETGSRAKPAIRALATNLTPPSRAGDYAEALMDLGSAVCAARAPRCWLCPVTGFCRSFADGEASLFPRKTVKPPKPVRYGVAFVMLSDSEQIWLRLRPARGLLAGMTEVPSSEWTERPLEGDFTRLSPVKDSFETLAWQNKGQITHVFTHFTLRLTILCARLPHAPNIEGAWRDVNKLDALSLPSLIRKAIKSAIP